eukprot:c7112_g1_i2.p1 GENE.c7112_g1_i2~~c7112_g1_i2.p1  ORF type:complete len:869 (+),score=279.07 c7112_g1_i2:57-2663(+)
MSNNVRVVVRFRPINEIEKASDSQDDVINVNTQEGVVQMRDHEQTRRFVFDNVFDGDVAQQEVYRLVGQPMVDQCLKGYNCTIFAYGQTGSGKSFSTFGRKHPGCNWATSPLKGIVPRALEHIFSSIEKLAEVSVVQMKVSFLELYQEAIRDLLKEGNNNLKIREPPDGEVYVQNLSEVFVLTAEEAMKVLETGEKLRTTASTRMNDTSSRSHCVFTLHLQQQKIDGSKLVSKLHFVDLAGSEAVKKTQAEGVRLDEAKAINLSLTTLAKVINALTDTKPTHPPFRDSQLTRLLRPALGGNSQTTVVVTCSPHIYNYFETLSSLRFAERAKKIHNHSKVNVELTREQLKAVVEQLKAELEKMTWMYLTLKQTGVDPGQNEQSNKIDDDGREGSLKLISTVSPDRSNSWATELTFSMSSSAQLALEDEDDALEDSKTARAKSVGTHDDDDSDDNSKKVSRTKKTFTSVDIAGYIKTIHEKDEEIQRLRDEMTARDNEMAGITSTTVNEVKRQVHEDSKPTDANKGVFKKEQCESSLFGIPLFKKLLDSEREEIARQMRIEQFKRGQVVCGKNIREKLVIVDRGELEVVKGEKSIRRLEAGDFYGEGGLVVSMKENDEELLAASAVASVWTIDRGTFAKKLGPIANILRRECAKMDEYRQLMLLDPSIQLIDMECQQLQLYLSEVGVDTSKAVANDREWLLRRALEVQRNEMEAVEERMHTIYRDLVKQRNINSKLAKEKWQLQMIIDNGGLQSDLDQMTFGTVKMVRPTSADSPAQSEDSTTISPQPEATGGSKVPSLALNLPRSSSSSVLKKIESAPLSSRPATVRGASMNKAIPLASTQAQSLGRRSIGRMQTRVAATDVFKSDPPK